MTSSVRTRQEDFGVISYDSSSDKFTLIPNKHFDKSEENILSGPLTAHWALTLRCNARCGYCYLLPVLKKVNEEEEILSKGETKKFIHSFAEAGGFRLYLTGGEPTLHPFIDKIMDYSAEEGIKIVVNTNGIQMPEQFYEVAKRTGASISFSLDSFVAEEHNRARKQKSFSSIVKMLERCRDAGVDTRVISVAERNEPSFWEQFGKFLSQAGVGRWFIQADNSKDISGIDLSLEEKLTSYFPSMRIRVIPAIYDSFLYILPDGTACSDAWASRVVYGKVPQDSVKDIWKRNKKNRLRDYEGIIKVEKA